MPRWRREWHSPAFAALLALSEIAGASCVRQPCYALTFETLSCKAETDVENRYPGARITVKPLRLREVACMPDYPLLLNSQPPPTDVVTATNYYYHVWSHEPCLAFRKPVTLFVSDRCCDVVPPSGECTIKEPVLKDLPPWAQQ